MTSVDSGTRIAVSLAQVLFESSPNSGWMGPWSSLRQEQIDWWMNYADIARQFILREDSGSAIDTSASEQFDEPIEQYPFWESTRPAAD